MLASLLFLEFPRYFLVSGPWQMPFPLPDRVCCCLAVWLVGAFVVSALRSVPFIFQYNPVFHSLTPFLFVLCPLPLTALQALW